ncbi:Uncharacterized protein FKW44_020343, partial [Caligus rogercresseyi]
GASRNGSFIIGTQILDNHSRFTALSLSLHEALQGITFSSHTPKRTNSLIPGELGSPTAFIEGWGLYSEYLGLEMGSLRIALFSSWVTIPTVSYAP